MTDQRWQKHFQDLSDRRAVGGGFAAQKGGQGRSDATAWAVLALAAAGRDTRARRAGCSFLAARQLADGRVPVHPEHPQAYWPTPLALLAWQAEEGFAAPAGKAKAFLLAHSGKHWVNKERDILAHDTALKGWPWIAQTHSWVEPTALCIMALRTVGQGGHPRVAEALKMLLDRQLPGGGWNYGNTKVFGQELHPMPEATGCALAALKGLVSEQQVAASLAYIKRMLPQSRTPLALAWILLALGAWGQSMPRAGDWIVETLERQARLGPFDTMALSLLLFAGEHSRGFMPWQKKE